jgi:WD40 repeat protein
MKYFTTSQSAKRTLTVWVLFIILVWLTTPIQAQNQNNEVRSIAWSPDGTRIALGGGPIFCDEDPEVDSSLYAISILDANTGQQVNSFDGHVCAVNSVAWSPDGTRLASAGDDGTAIVWDTLTGQRVSALQDSYGRGVRVTGLAWSPDGQSLAHFIDLGRSPLVIWNANNGQTVNIIDIAEDVESLTWSPDGSKLAIGNFNRSVQILNVATGQILNTFEAFSQDGRVTSVGWSPDGSKLAVSGIGLRILDAVTGQVILTLSGHAGNSTIFVSWSPDGSKLASVGGLDNTIRIWDTQTGLELGVFPTQQLQVFSVAWSPDGSKFAYATSGRTVEIIASPQVPTPTPTFTPTATPRPPGFGIRYTIAQFGRVVVNK